jgi:lysophospholipase L1-like esterase
MKAWNLGVGLFLTLPVGAIGCGGAGGASQEEPGDANLAAPSTEGGGSDASGSIHPGDAAAVDDGPPVSAEDARPTGPAGDDGGNLDSGASDSSSPGADSSSDASAVPDAAVDAAALPAVTLWVAGDSTASVYGPASAQQGWGEHLADFLISKVTVNDQGFPGRTVVTFMASSHWTTIENGMKPGDYVMIEFGINDSSTAGGRLVTIPVFTSTLGMMVEAIVAKKATPIMVTPSALQYWVNGQETNAREQPYVDAMKAVAMQNDIQVDDLNALSVDYLNMIGQTAAEQIYINGDKAHFTLKGATEMANLITQELVTIGSPLGAYVK